MAVTKKYLKNKPDVCRVRFELNGDDAKGVEQVCVAGDFNDWDICAAPMDKHKDAFVYTVDLPAGRQYSFRYIIDSQVWHNDSQADHYENSGVGDSLNSVIVV